MKNQNITQNVSTHIQCLTCTYLILVLQLFQNNPVILLLERFFHKIDIPTTQLLSVLYNTLYHTDTVSFNYLFQGKY